MKKLVILLILVLPLAGCGEEKKPTSLKETIRNMLVLVEENRDAELIEKYADMSKFGHAQANIPAVRMAELKTALKVVQKLDPVFSEGGRMAVFTDPQLPRPMKFVRLDGVWRLQN